MKKTGLYLLFTILTSANILAQIEAIDSSLKPNLELQKFERETRETYAVVKIAESAYSIGSVAYSLNELGNNNDTRFNKTNFAFNSSILLWNSIEYLTLLKRPKTGYAIYERRDRFHKNFMGQGITSGVVMVLGALFSSRSDWKYVNPEPFNTAQEFFGIQRAAMQNGFYFMIANFTGALLENSFGDNVQPIIQNNQLGLSIRF